jgi:crotonobetainyl-CoA:carnitine CoA-transferase CaiB-like acyl-CoA transferase
VASILASPIPANAPDLMVALPVVATSSKRHPDEQGLSVGLPVVFGGGSTASAESAAPCGSHTREVLLELGYSVPEIDGLVTSGATPATG